MTADRNRLSGLRVFVVEDEALILEWFEDILQDLGCQLAGHALSVTEALDQIDDVEFDVAMLDVHLARVPVFPVAERISARGIPIVFVTGGRSDQLPPQWRQCRILPKPFDPEQVAEALRAISNLIAKG
jgi:DNA-binding response OmpR family regulator